MNPTPFIVASYAAFALFLALDLLLPLLRRRQLLRDLATRAKRVAQRTRT